MAGFAAADTVRVASFNVSLGRRGPGVLLKDIVEDDEQVLAVIQVIQTVQPDILVMQAFDHDDRGLALVAFREKLAAGPDGIDYPYWFAPPGNEGRPSFMDLNGDGYENDWADSLGFGKFPGGEAMAMLSRYPIGEAHTFAKILWRDLPDANLPVDENGDPFLAPEVLEILPMSYRSHWDVQVIIAGQPIHILAAHTTPPVFDGPENLNGIRNAAEVGFWVHYLDGKAFPDDEGQTVTASAPFIVVGDYNADPNDGEGFKAPIRALLSHPQIFDPEPMSAGGAVVSGKVNIAQIGDPAMDTADWGDEIGNMRVDYVLPSSDLRVERAAVVWPNDDDPFFEIVEEASHHRMVWVDVRFTEAQVPLGD